MKPIGFWEEFLNDSMSPTERARLNEAAAEINQLSALNQQSWTQIRNLFRLDKAQSAELENLRTTVRVLTEALLDAGCLDRTLLSERMESAFKELELRRNPVPAEASTPYRDGATRPAVVEPTTTCGMCGEDVVVRMTTITATGVVCDRCFETMS